MQSTQPLTILRYLLNIGSNDLRQTIVVTSLIFGYNTETGQGQC